MTGRASKLRPVAALLVVLALAAPCWPASTLDAAAGHYRTAKQLYEDLLQVPPLELGTRQYELVISEFKKVHRADASSGYADDSLLAIAELYEAMSQRFGQAKYRRKAIEAYRFAAAEYPQSKHRLQALTMASRLSIEPLPAASSTSRAARAPVGAVQNLAALSDERHDEGEVIQPPEGPAPGAGIAGITQVRHHSYPDGTRIVLHMSQRTALKYDRLHRPERLFIDVFGSRLSNELISGLTLDVADALLSTARVAQNRRSKARLVLDLRHAVSFDAFWLDSPTRLVFDIRPAGAARASRTIQALNPVRVQPIAPRAASATADGRHSLTRALGLKLDRILVDAGHGGHDTGSIGSGGLREKDVALDIAKRLGKLLEARLGVDVIQTRTSDVFVPLEERTRIANERQADLMISIHCNSAPRASVRGIETYYLSLTSDSWELSVASFENAASNSSVHELAGLVQKIALDERIDESREFATKVQSRLHTGVSRRAAGVRDRGIRKAPFVVLIGAEMPAVLAEIAFISNREDEQLLRKASFRQEVAEHLFAGIAEYAGSLGGTTIRSSLSAGSASRD